MRPSGRSWALLAVMALLSACVTVAPTPRNPSPTPLPTSPSLDQPFVRNATGLVPLVEILPPAQGPELVTATYKDLDTFGDEGYLVFVRITDTHGTVIVDHHIPYDDELSIGLDPGHYGVIGYYRNCNGNCAYLDPLHTLCYTALRVVAGESAAIVISVAGRTCAVQPG